MSQGEVKRIMEFSGRERRARYFLTEIAPIVAGVPDYVAIFSLNFLNLSVF